MNWHYATGAEQKGPVNEDEFQQLVQQGVVTSQTLVWREGMADWQPYGHVASTPDLPRAATSGSICAGCGHTFPAAEVIPLSGAVYCAACKPLALQRLKEGASGSTAAEQMRKEHLKHEASIKSVGLLYYLGGAGLLLVGLMSFLSITRDGPRLAILVGVFLLLLGAGQLWVGTGLRRLQKWARVPTGILSGLGLLGFPLGTLINGYILYLVFSQKGQTVFSDEYQAVIQQTPHIKYRTSIVVWILFGLLVLALVAGLFAAFVGSQR